MTAHKTGTHEEWLAARLELLDAEKEHTRRGDELARRRQELPWVPVSEEQWDSGAAEYNFISQDLRPATDEQKAGLDEFASRIVGTDWATYRQEGPGMSAFAVQDGAVYHTYSAYARGLDGLWGMYQW